MIQAIDENLNASKSCYLNTTAPTTLTLEQKGDIARLQADEENQNPSSS